MPPPWENQTVSASHPPPQNSARRGELPVRGCEGLMQIGCARPCHSGLRPRDPAVAPPTKRCGRVPAWNRGLKRNPPIPARLLFAPPLALRPSWQRPTRRPRSSRTTGFASSNPESWPARQESSTRNFSISRRSQPGGSSLRRRGGDGTGFHPLR